MIYANHMKTSQTEKTPGRDEVKNNAGGYVYQVSPWEQLDRFLILGTIGGTYYVKEQTHTVKNADEIIQLIRADGEKVVAKTCEISHQGRAIKNDPAIFVLALCASHGNPETKAAAYKAITTVCRTSTHLFTFFENVKAMRGWSRGLKNGCARFYESKTDDQLAYQLVKYRQRNGWTHRDTLRLCHPKNDKTKDSVRAGLYQFALEKPIATTHPLVTAFEEVQTLGNDKKSIQKIVDLTIAHKLPWEAIPTNLLREPMIWEGLINHVPLTALIRNLGRLSNIGLVTSKLQGTTQEVMKKLTNQQQLLQARLHPLSILVALKTYAQGHGDKGSLKWTPTAGILEALNSAFSLSFGNVEKTNKRFYFGLDVSGSMSSQLAGSPVSCREASVAMAMINNAVEDWTEVAAFGNKMLTFTMPKNASLEQLCTATARLPWATTDCALPMLDATARKLPVDVFVIYTDNETYAGNVKPVDALANYRKKMGIDAKLIVVGMTATGFTIADPKDPRTLDIVGFDTNTPKDISEFAKNN